MKKESWTRHTQRVRGDCPKSNLKADSIWVEMECKKLKDDCYMLDISIGWIASPRGICLSPNTWSLWRWPYLEKIFADIVELRILRWDHLGFRMGPKSNDWTLDPSKRRGRFRYRERQGEGPMKMRLKIGWVQLQAKQYLRSPETGRSKEGCSPRAFRGTLTLVVPWFWTSDPQSSEIINSY